jgi:Glycosyltransferase Family 4
MSGLRVLITNGSLVARSGTEMVVRDLAWGLYRRGHTPVVYSPHLGPVADELRAGTIAVADDLRNIGSAPDVIHGHHHPETVAALLHFPDVPALFTCHSRLHLRDAPPRSGRIYRYVAVDDTCRERLIDEHGIPPERTAVLRNAVDLQRFRPRSPLPPRPGRALVFSHYASEHTFLPAVRRACEQVGLPLDVVGLSAGNTCERPGQILGHYDLVFGKARCALEAIAVGTAVILCDCAGVGGMVTAAEVERLRSLNFGLRALREPVTVEVLLREIARYNPDDAAAATRHVRQTAGVETMIDTALNLYGQVLAEHRDQPALGLAEERREFAAYLRWLTSMKDLCAFAEQARWAMEDRDRHRAVADQLRKDLHEVLADRERIRNGWRMVQNEYDRLLFRCQDLRGLADRRGLELDRISRSGARRWLRRLCGSIYRALVPRRGSGTRP